MRIYCPKCDTVYRVYSDSNVCPVCGYTQGISILGLFFKCPKCKKLVFRFVRVQQAVLNDVWVINKKTEFKRGKLNTEIKGELIRDSSYYCVCDVCEEKIYKIHPEDILVAVSKDGRVIPLGNYWKK